MDTKRMMDVAQAQMRGMLDALNKIAMNSGVAKKADKSGTRKATKKTQPGAIHKHGKVFLARRISPLTPAQYRNQHMGLVVIVPNYLKPHPAPRWRNRWTSQNS